MVCASLLCAPPPEHVTEWYVGPCVSLPFCPSEMGTYLFPLVGETRHGSNGYNGLPHNGTDHKYKPSGPWVAFLVVNKICEHACPVNPRAENHKLGSGIFIKHHEVCRGCRSQQQHHKTNDNDNGRENGRPKTGLCHGVQGTPILWHPQFYI